MRLRKRPSPQGARTARRARLRPGLVALPLAALTALAATLVVPAADAAVIGDDYPARVAKKNVDPWRFYSGECTSFAAWRITHELGFTPFDDYWLVHWGNASNWKRAARSSAVRAAGVRVNQIPKVGAIAWWSAGSAGSSSGHVAWVAVVNDTSITIEEYNYLHHHKYDIRTISRTDARWPTGFIHFPPKSIENTALPTISGKVRVGETLTATKGRWSVAGKAYAYQWLADGKPVKGATAKTFTVDPGSYDKQVTVRVTASKKGFDKVAATSAPTRPVLPGRFVNTARPTISGTAQVGQPLSATTGSWQPGGSYAYQWLAAGQPVPGATGATFTPGPAQVDQKVNVLVTSTRAGYKSRHSYGTPVVVADGQMQLRSRPAIRGVPQLGRPLTVQAPVWNVPAVRSVYQWYADGQVIVGATASSFTPTLAQLGRALTVVATASADGYVDATATSPAARAVTRGTVTFPGRARVTGKRLLGRVLTAHVRAPSPAGAQVHYQWYRGKHRINGATGARYRTVRADVARHLSVRVTGAAASWTDGAIRSKRLSLIRSRPVITAKASLSGPRERYLRIHVRIKAPGVAHVFGHVGAFEHGRRLGVATVRAGHGTVSLGTLSRGRHHLVLKFRAEGAARSGVTRMVVSVP